MNDKHLTEEEIQQYVLGTSVNNEEHLAGCEACRSKASAYRLLFTALAEQPPASFDFDLASLVMEKMAGQSTVSAEPAARRIVVTGARPQSLLVAVLAIAGLSLPVAFLLIYGSTLSGLFSQLTPIILPLISTAVLTVIVFLATDMYKQYRKKLLLLEIS